jgi:Spy/CpxP family protein refolding chaperone
MKSSLSLSVVAAGLLLAPVLSSAQTKDTASPKTFSANDPALIEYLRAMQAPAQGDAVQPGRVGRNRPGIERLMQRRQAMGQALQGGQNMPPRQNMREALGLTEAQQADMRKMRETAQRDRLRKSTDLKIAAMDLKSLLRAEKVDEKAVATKLAEVQAARGALMKMRIDNTLAMKRILTPEQQKKMAELRAHRGVRAMGQRMQNRRGVGRGQARDRVRGRAGRMGAGRPGFNNGIREEF